ncbi:MAG TPA: amidohydrolase family protein [Ramlibacter sp.]|nr:amidohydrolase family protein [Ramlibacter sp.]
MGEPGVFARGTQAPDEAWLARALPEPALDPEVPVVDPHMHFWHHKSGYRYFVEEFARDVAASGHDVQGTVYVECGSMYRAGGPEHLRSVGEAEFAVGQAAIAASGKYTKALGAAGIIGFADLTLGPLARETVDAHVAAANGRFRGIRQRAKWDGDPAVRGPVSADGPGLFLRPEFGEGLDYLTSVGLLFEASVFHHQLPDVVALARAHPDARIVIGNNASPVGHSSYAGKEAEVHAQWLSGIRALAGCSNVSIKLGGLLMSLGSFDFTRAERPPSSDELADLWRPWIEPCLDILGPDRCMASSNFPVDKAGMPYGTVWNAFKRIAGVCSASEKRLLLAGNAKRIYGLVLA